MAMSDDMKCGLWAVLILLGVGAIVTCGVGYFCTGWFRTAADVRSIVEEYVRVSDDGRTVAVLGSPSMAERHILCQQLSRAGFEPVHSVDYRAGISARWTRLEGFGPVCPDCSGEALLGHAACHRLVEGMGPPTDATLPPPPRSPRPRR